MASGEHGMRAMGRGALLQAFSPPRPGTSHHYKPVSVNEGLPGAATAIPGECAVSDSWRYLSSAPVAYQMQQMLNAREELKIEKEYPVLPSYKRQTDTVLSLTQSCTNSAAAPATTTITTDIPQKAGETVHGKYTETADYGNSGNGLWEPCFLDSFVPPDIGSPAEFPSLMQSNPALKKK